MPMNIQNSLLKILSSTELLRIADLCLKIRKPAIRAKFIEIGSVPIEFIQPIEGEPSIYKEFLDSKGEGVQHIAFGVGNFDEEEAKLTDQGVSIMAKGKAPAAFGSISAHFDTRQAGDFAIQLIQDENN